MSYSPWGKIDNVEKIVNGVTRVYTPSHGGIRITEKALREYACDYDFLIKRGAIKLGEYYFFEEDCAMALMLFDCPRILQVYARKFTLKKDEVIFQQCKGSVMYWYPDYFNEERN